MNRDIKITLQPDEDSAPVDMSYLSATLDYDFKRMIWNNRRVVLVKSNGAIYTYEGYLGED